MDVGPCIVAHMDGTSTTLDAGPLSDITNREVVLCVRDRIGELQTVIKLVL